MHNDTLFTQCLSYQIQYLYSQKFWHNCTSTESSYYDIAEIQSKINDYACNSNLGHYGLSYRFSDCSFSLNALKQIVNTISSHIMKCKDHIVSYLSSHKHYNIKIEFEETENNTSIGLEGVNYIANATHTISKNLSTISPHSTDFTVYFQKYGVLESQVYKLSRSCSNIKVLSDPNSFVHSKIIKSGYWGVPIWEDVYDQNQFFLKVTNANINNTACIFNQRSDIPESSAMHGEEQNLNTGHISSLIGLGLIIGSVSGLYVLGRYVYNKYCASNETVREAYYALQPDVVCAGTEGVLHDILVNPG